MCEGWGGVDIVLALVIINVVLSALQFLLEKIKVATQNKCAERAYNVVSFLLTMLNWAMANRGKK